MSAVLLGSMYAAQAPRRCVHGRERDNNFIIRVGQAESVGLGAGVDDAVKALGINIPEEDLVNMIHPTDHQHRVGDRKGGVEWCPHPVGERDGAGDADNPGVTITRGETNRRGVNGNAEAETGGLSDEVDVRAIIH